MATITEFRFTVEGRGPFPIDMLRYDRCWPQTGEDAGAIQGTFSGNIAGRSVALTGLTIPTSQRWKSFGWLVEDVEKVKVTA